MNLLTLQGFHVDVAGSRTEHSAADRRSTIGDVAASIGICREATKGNECKAIIPGVN
jgi:hypothetical protein